MCFIHLCGLCLFPAPSTWLPCQPQKRVIYWQTIFGSHAIAFVPEQGDPLGGINYSRFGLYAFGGHERFSLQLWIDDYLSKRRVTALFWSLP